MASPPPRRSGTATDWDRAYLGGRPPWDIGRAQPAFVRLADAGEFTAPLLDSGCGTGEHALMAAALGLEVVGIDHAPAAIERAREKAAGLGLSVRFIHGDVLELANLGRAFATVIDSGTFHVFDDTDRDRYVRSLAASLQPGGVLHLLCFSEHTAGTEGPRRVTQAEIRDAFADGWSIERIVAEAFEVTEAWPGEPPRAWLARIVRDRR